MAPPTPINPSKQPSLRYLQMQCSKRNLPTKGSKQTLIKRLNQKSQPPPSLDLNQIQDRVALLSSPYSSEPASPNHPELNSDLEILLPLLLFPGAPSSNASSIKRFFDIASPPILQLAHKHGLLRNNQLVPNSSPFSLIQALRLLSSPPLPPSPIKSFDSTRMDQALHSSFQTPPPVTSFSTPNPPDQSPFNNSTPTPSTDTPLTASLLWSCERDPIQYGLAIRTSIDYLNKHSHDYGERNLAFTKAQVEASMASAISQDSSFDSARTQFIAHVVDFLELAATRALHLNQPNNHSIRLTQKAQFLDAFNELSNSLQDPNKADPTKKFLRVIILAALGRLFSPAQTAAFKRMGINLPPSFYGCSPSAPSYISAAQQPAPPPRPPPYVPRPPPSAPRRPIQWTDRQCGKHCPNSAEIIGESTPGAVIKRNTRCSCGSHQHEPFECYAQWFSKFRRPLPGFIQQDGKWVHDPAMWNGNNITPALARIWLAVIASGKCTESPYSSSSRRQAPDFNSLANSP